MERQAFDAPSVDVLLRQFLCQALKREDVRPEDNFMKLGGDSLGAVEVLMRIRSELGVRVPMAYFLQNPTLSALSDFLLSRAGETADNMSEEELFALLPPTQK